MKHILICENIRSMENVGSILRTCEAVGIEKIFCVGTTPTPIDRFGREVQKINKASLGAEKIVDWKYTPTTTDALRACAHTHTPVCVELSVTAIPYTEYNYSIPTAFIFGNEVDGVSPETLLQVKKHIAIPMFGKKESLNVAVAVGIILYKSKK
ncbi:MAG: TrmH family RNA methyltransferase [Alphaproteobacteria bacterium]|nr:TrmH family RNA methyltransferase [Alphaproteobacteria bacterium]